MTTVDKYEIIVDGQSELIITHSKKRILIEIAFFLFWAAIGITLIVFGSRLVGFSELGLGIPMIIIGIFFVIVFFESFLAKLTNKIILNQKGIKTRIFIKWYSLSWIEIDAFEIEKRASSVMRSNWSSRITIMKIISNSGDQILYPLFRFTVDEAENIVILIKDYFKANRGIELNEKIIKFSGKKEFEPTNDSDENHSLRIENEIESQVPPRVEEYEIEDDTINPST